jgi:hypothetical protein
MHVLTNRSLKLSQRHLAARWRTAATLAAALAGAALPIAVATAQAGSDGEWTMPG